MEDSEKYRGRYKARPETFEAYVDVWDRIGAVGDAFSGWVAFSQAANAEPAQDSQRVRLAEDLMDRGGYEIAEPTPRGARRWRRMKPAQPAAGGSSQILGGLREIAVRHATGTTRIEGAQGIEVFFGPHHLLRIAVNEGATTMELVTTHHGVRFDASEVGGELETIIEELRNLHPDSAID